MRTPSRHIARAGLLILAAGLAAASPAHAQVVVAPAQTMPDAAAVERRPHDFSDKYLLEHGINPAALLDRPAGLKPDSTISPVLLPGRRDIRMLHHTPAWGASGEARFATEHGSVYPSTFTRDMAGINARQIAESCTMYEFPRAETTGRAKPRRQECLLQADEALLNPLGIWRVAEVRYSPASRTPQGRRFLREMAIRNGTDLDGTPLVRSAADLDLLASRGLVSIHRRPTDGSAGAPWVLRPIMQDPRHFAIAPDAHLGYVARKTGEPNPGERLLLSTFRSLQTTGQFPG